MDVEKNSNEAQHPEIVSAQQSAALCQSCGLCCNGSLFSFVALKKPDLEALKGTPIPPRIRKIDRLGIIRGKLVKPTISDKVNPCPAPNMLWVSDFIYIAT
ncbi:hypothetical protein [Kordiimonas sp.]|uniref:hypothetical protein n=1 Tax=Kordiimonas sp. TaxID=1970157 RepID=UPI003A947222